MLHFGTCVDLMVHAELGVSPAARGVCYSVAMAGAAHRQSPKLDADVRPELTHELNNDLAVIISSFELMKRQVTPGDNDIDRLIDGGLAAAQRAAALSHRIAAGRPNAQCTCRCDDQL